MNYKKHLKDFLYKGREPIQAFQLQESMWDELQKEEKPLIMQRGGVHINPCKVYPDDRKIFEFKWREGATHLEIGDWIVLLKGGWTDYCKKEDFVELCKEPD